MNVKIEDDRHFFIIQILFTLTLSIASVPVLGIGDNEVEDNKKFIFFHEILYRVEEPLQYAVWKQRGDKLQSNTNFYKKYNEPMEFFRQQYEDGELVGPGEFFGSLVKVHSEQARGLFHFLYQPLDWNVFVQNACWARQNINAHMFVYAFTLAAIHRQMYHAMMLPDIYEILPRYFFDRNFVKSVKEFNFTMPIKPQMTTNRPSRREENFHIWQWWKSIEPYDLRWRFYNYNLSLKSSTNAHYDEDEVEEVKEDSRLPVELKTWWRSVDYTRDLNVMNKQQAQLTYLMEDVDWNAYWYSLNLFYSSFLPGEEIFWSNETETTRRGEFWLYCLQQMMTRYELERLSYSFDQTPTFEWHNVIEDGYDPYLVDSGGHEFDSRANNFQLKTTMDNFENFIEARYALKRIEEIITDGHYRFKNGSLIDMLGPDSIEILGNLFQCNIDALDRNYDTHWYQLSQMYLTGGADHKNFQIQPNVLLNFETQLRDPLFYIFHKRIVNNLQRFRESFLPYSNAELHDTVFEIISADVSELVTYFNLFETDVSNLGNSNSNSNRNLLIARQMRLSHKPFNFNLTIKAEKAMTASLRIFLAPTHDKYGNLIMLQENRKTFIELHKIIVHLKKGENNKIFNYEKYFEQSNGRDDEFPTKNYFNALNNDPTKQRNLFRSYGSSHYCVLNERLLLPKGLSTGLSMQLFFILNSDRDMEDTQNVWWKLCSPLNGKRSFGYPFDRPILNENNFKLTNMFWKYVKIYHKDINLDLI